MPYPCNTFQFRVRNKRGTALFALPVWPQADKISIDLQLAGLKGPVKFQTSNFKGMFHGLLVWAG